MKNALILAVLCIAVLMQGCGGDASDFRNSRWGDSREAVLESETTRLLVQANLFESCIGYVGEHRSVANSDSLVFKTTLTNILSFSDAEKTPEQISEEVFPISKKSEVSVKIVYNFNDAGRLDSAYIGDGLFTSPFLNESRVRELTQHAVELHGKPTSISVNTEKREIDKPYWVTITTLTWQTKSRRITLCFEKSSNFWKFLWSYETC